MCLLISLFYLGCRACTLIYFMLSVPVCIRQVGLKLSPINKVGVILVPGFICLRIDKKYTARFEPQRGQLTCRTEPKNLIGEK